MINGINPALQSATQTLARPEEQRELRQEPARIERSEENSPAVKVSLQQVAQNAGQQAVQDYRALGQKATLAANQTAATDGQNNRQQAEQQQMQLRNQAYLATAALKSGR